MTSKAKGEKRFSLTVLFGPDPASSRVETVRTNALRDLRDRIGSLPRGAHYVLVDEREGRRIEARTMA